MCVHAGISLMTTYSFSKVSKKSLDMKMARGFLPIQTKGVVITPNTFWYLLFYFPTKSKSTVMPDNEMPEIPVVRKA